MKRDADDVFLSFLTKAAPPAFRVRQIIVPPGAASEYASKDWSDTLVIVESGTIELESMSGLRRTFVAGDILFLAALHLRLLRNTGPLPAVLSATSRAR